VIFHEKLNLKFDVSAMQEEITSLQKLGDRIGQETDNEASNFGGWTLQSDDGDWRRGFEKGAYYEDENNKQFTSGAARTPHEYDTRTDACVGIFSDIIDELEEKGFYPHRSRITVLDPGKSTSWHADAMKDDYSVRIHIPFITNPDCVFRVRDEGSVHMPADGYAHLVDVSRMHRAYNRGESIRMHFLAQVWVTKYSKHFIVTESQKNIMSFHNMIGYQIYQQVMSEKAKS
jgi:hypothetical protein